MHDEMFFLIKYFDQAFQARVLHPCHFETYNFRSLLLLLTGKHNVSFFFSLSLADNFKHYLTILLKLFVLFCGIFIIWSSPVSYVPH